MVSLYSITGRFWSRLRFDRIFQLKASIIAFFLLSMIFGMGDGLIFSFGWISLGLMGFILLYRLQERYFFVSIWMSIVYSLIFVGSLVAFKYAEIYNNWFLQIFGFSIMVIAFVLSLYLILLIKDKRDILALEGEYVPIGFWSILVLLFFWSSVFSQVGFIRWADGSLNSLTLYFLTEIILIPTFLLIVTFPEDRLKIPGDGPRRDVGPFKKIIDDITFGDMKKRFSIRSRTEEIPDCPRCKLKLSREVKKCPTCGSARNFYWCTTSQDYLVRCPSCSKLTMIGNDRCIHCNSRISCKVRCSKCRDVNRVDDWTK